MAIAAFPPIEQADEHGLLAFGGDLDVSSLILAYSQGIFPWPIDPEAPMAWFSPDPRGILPFDQIQLGRSLIKSLKKVNWQVSFNGAFFDVITACQTNHQKKSLGTWISDEILIAYHQLFLAGHAYSVEIWEDGHIIGGVYGVSMGNFLSGESMFYQRSNASKLALIVLANTMKHHHIHWLDTQMVTPAVQDMGGIYISRPEFISKLNKALLNQSLTSVFHRKKTVPIIPNEIADNIKILI